MAAITGACMLAARKTVVMVMAQTFLNVVIVLMGESPFGLSAVRAWHFFAAFASRRVKYRAGRQYSDVTEFFLHQVHRPLQQSRQSLTSQEWSVANRLNRFASSKKANL